MNVYGQNSPASEETPLETCGEFYVDAKLAAEGCLEELADGPDRPRVTILRIPAGIRSGCAAVDDAAAGPGSPAQPVRHRRG